MPTVFCHSDIFVSGRANLTRAPPHGRGISTIPSASVVPPLGRVGQWCGDARPGVGPRGLRRRNGTRRAAPRPADHLGPAMEPRPIRVRPSPPIHPYTAGSARFRTGCGRGRRGVFVHLAILVPTWIDESTRQHPVGPADLNVARTSWVVVNSFGACPSLCWVGCMRMPWNVIASFSSVTYIQSVTPAYRWATMSTENQSLGEYFRVCKSARYRFRCEERTRRQGLQRHYARPQDRRSHRRARVLNWAQGAAPIPR